MNTDLNLTQPDCRHLSW